MQIGAAVIDAELLPRLQQGHPWVYRQHLHARTELTGGQWVAADCAGRRFYGLYDAESPIALRIYSRERQPDRRWLQARVAEAWQLRAPLYHDGETDAFRWISGEGDGLPGVIVDRYGDYAVIEVYADAVQRIVAPLVAAMTTVDRSLRGVIQRGRGEGQDKQGEPRLIWGEYPPQELVIREHGRFMAVDLRFGQKTGLFLDQRDNRTMVGKLAAGLTVLNCFAYTGGFSLAALIGGAQQVVSCDVGRGLAAAADRNLQLNGIDPGRHEFVTADCFVLLDEYARSGRRFDLVILDPPSFAHTRAQQRAAARAYVRLNTLGMRCVVPGGLLVTASCTAQIAPDHFRELIGEAAGAGGYRVQLLHESGHGLDHPISAALPEGRYLKCVTARIAAPI
jgi:23S rRNA (cytosine1962-C5)-methyltransferase